MKFNVDSFISGTKTHPVCEDYAVSHADDNHPLILVSDGCSTSMNTDIGARLLAHCFKNRYLLELEQGFPPNHTVAKHAMTKAAYLLDELNVPYAYQRYEPLNATVVVAYIHDDKIYVQFYGDGCMVIERRDGRMDIYTVKVENNAPYYIAYEKSSDLIASYINTFGISKVQVTCTVTTKSQPDQRLPIITECTINDRIQQEFDVHDIVNISVISDGIEMLRNVKLQLSYDPIDAIFELHNWKSYTGAFVQRRCRKFFDKIAVEGYIGLDDFSMATIHIEHEV